MVDIEEFEVKEIIEAARERGWVLEPDAKAIFARAGLDVPRYRVAVTEQEAARYGGEIGYPLVAKLISPKALHKSDVGGVAVGITGEDELRSVYARFSRFPAFRGVHLEEMADGLELIVGAKIDPQFGPVVLLGIGGTSVEIYQDTSIRMAPLEPRDVLDMVASLKARPLLAGYRGSEGVHMQKLTDTVVLFSELVMDLAHDIESIDLNPVMCNAGRCVIADARIMVKKE